MIWLKKTRSNGFSDTNREDWIYFLGSCR